VTRDLLLPLDALRRHHGVIREVGVQVTLDDLAIGTVEVIDGRVDLSLLLEVRGDEIAVSGVLRADWTGECRRCLDSVSGHLDLEINEVCVPDRPDSEGNPPDTGDVYLLSGENLDLEPIARDAVLLALPLSPLCGDQCEGPDAERYPAGDLTNIASDEQPSMDPRWAVLDILREGADGEGNEQQSDPESLS
jgi:uncharacterized protein|tara:strand:- start:13513 stop:14088 length:576 start_codon:yes stop_codon:yes gene_type:complete